MTYTLLRSVLVASVLVTAAPAYGDDSGQKREPYEIFLAIDDDTRKRAVALLRKRKVNAAIVVLAASTSLNVREATYAAGTLGVNWNRFGLGPTDKIMGHLDPSRRDKVVQFVTDGRSLSAFLVLALDAGLPHDESSSAIRELEDRLRVSRRVWLRTVRPDAEIMAGLSAAERERVLELIVDGKKIAAVRDLRDATGLGLKDAKDVVDAIQFPTNDKD